MFGGDAANMTDDGGEVSIRTLFRRGVAGMARSCSRDDGDDRSLSLLSDVRRSLLPAHGTKAPRPAADRQCPV